MNINDKQVGGTHYTGEYNHWDMVELNGMGYLEGCASKYVYRWKDKGTGLLDVEKAGHYVEKLIDMARNHGRINRATPSMNPSDPWEISSWCFNQNMGSLETQICSLLMHWQIVDDLVFVQSKITDLTQQAYKLENDEYLKQGHPTNAYVDQD